MKIKELKFDPNMIEPSERTPVVLMLLSVIEKLTHQLEQKTEQLAKQSEKIDLLLNEIRCLKKLSKKPKLQASSLPKDKNDNDEPPANGNNSGNTRRAGSSKRSKNKGLKIDKEEIIAVEKVPVGSIRKGYQNYTIQDLLIKPTVTQYRLERWQLPEGGYIIANLPEELRGHHFGPTLRAYILHQYHHQCVTQPLLRKQLLEWGIDISAGQLNSILTENKEEFHSEKASILSVGLSSNYIQVDDTGARHKGKNGYCTFIGNELFSWFESTGSKSRLNFLKLLHDGHTDYQFTAESFAYMKQYKVTLWIRDKIEEANEKLFTSHSQFEAHLNSLGITHLHYRKIITEAALIGSIFTHGFSIDTVIMSDDAGQFNILSHALCWIHAERGIKSLLASNDIQAKAISWARNEIWEIYQRLRDYKNNPTSSTKVEIIKRFDTLCTTKTNYHSLNLALRRLYKNKSELLLVLERPDIPLHNNLSERDIREYVKRRKISGSTRSDEGRRCRDTFASLKKTAIKMGIGFWDYLIDRISKKYLIPNLDKLILEATK